MLLRGSPTVTVRGDLVAAGGIHAGSGEYRGELIVHGRTRAQLIVTTERFAMLFAEPPEAVVVADPELVTCPVDSQPGDLPDACAGRDRVAGRLPTWTSLRAPLRAELAAATTDIDLARRDLYYVPGEIFATTGLRRLSLAGNPLTTVPDRIGELSELTHLNLAVAQLRDLPTGIGRLRNLTELDISHNCLTGLPAILGELEQLSVLSARALRDENVEVLTRLAALEQLDLSELRPWARSVLAPIDFPHAITGLHRLKVLTLTGINLHELPAELLDLACLEHLDLTGSLGARLVDFPDLSRLPRLRVLRLSGSGRSRTFLPESTADRLWNLTGLEELALARWGGDRSRRAPCAALPDDAFTGMVHLRRLDLSGNGLSTLPESLFHLRHLDHLDLRYTKLDEPTRQRLRAALPATRIEI